ncbi:MAG: hypothetical protein JJU22_03275 [Gammaproteobacteria bacterium]|jgi:hypothetical protein|nr:hypothetical protein [Gammaproteobacteria bacterium]
MAYDRALSIRARVIIAATCFALAPSVLATPDEFASLSDGELQQHIGQWDNLSVDERRALLTEVHRRMLRAGKRPVLRIQGERRFGYRVEQPDGSVVEFEGREGFVHYQTVNPEKPFGVGFERRSGEGLPEDLLEALSQDDSQIDIEGRKSPVPAAGSAPVYRLPVREIQAPERPQR